MTAIMASLLLVAVLLAPFGLAAALATASHRSGTLRLFDDSDADARRIGHDLDAIRTRFEEQPVWPSSGALGERR
jgi:hypothetical protein